ncbi:MAG TPA: acetyl-CoA hydrolase/transferase C-terminal domain-containing protein, partial [Myxococcota bacterium]
IDAYPLFTRAGVHLRSGFFGPVERGLRASGFDVQFVPADFRRFATIARSLAPRVMATAAAPPDAQGRASLALHAGATVAELHAAGRDPERLLVVETHPDLPRTLGVPPDHPHELTLDEIDVLVESDRPLFTLEESAPSPIDRAIAGHARRFIEDGCTLQTGIGAIPSEIAHLLAEDRGGDYGVHSEMFTDGLMQLHRAGKVSNRKGSHDGYSAVTFAMGSGELYRWLDGNPEVRFLPVDCVNAHEAIGRNRSVLSVNGALAVDLLGQVAADALDGRQYSGIGGHMDFVAGAALSPGGRSLICLPSTAKAGGEIRSRLVAQLPAGTLVTTPRHEVDVVVTEHGAAELAGRSVDERAEALIAVAHPDHRDALREAWQRASRAPGS